MNIKNSWTNALMIGLFIFIAQVSFSYLTSDDIDEIAAKSYVSLMNDDFKKKGAEGRLYLDGYKSVQRDGYQVVTVSTTFSSGSYETKWNDRLVFVKGNWLLWEWHTDLNDLLKGE